MDVEIVITCAFTFMKVNVKLSKTHKGSIVLVLPVRCMHVTEMSSIHIHPIFTPALPSSPITVLPLTQRFIVNNTVSS